VQSCVTRFVADLGGQGRVEEGRRLASWLYVRYLALTLLGAAGVSVAAMRTWRPAADAQVWIALMVCLVSQAMGAFSNAYLAGAQEFERMARVNLISSAALVVGAALGMVLGGLPGILLGYAGGSAVPAFLSCALLRRRTRIGRAMAARCLKYSALAWCAALVSACVWSRIEVFFLERYWGSREVAMFSIGLTLSALATQGPMLLSSALMPHFAQSAGASTMADRVTYAKATRLLAALLFPLSLGTASLLPALLPVMYGAAFEPAVPNAMVLVAFSFVSLMNVGSALVYASGRSWFVAASGFAGAVLSLLGCALVIPVWGAWGASLSRSAVQSVMAIVGTWYIHRHLGCPAPLRVLGKLFGASLMAALSSYAVIHSNPSLPAIALAVLAAVVVYLAMLRLLRALEGEDAESLRSALGRMPTALSAPACGLLGWLAV
jgi:O-antigen/teichoic acid export membrane protein